MFIPMIYLFLFSTLGLGLFLAVLIDNQELDNENIRLKDDLARDLKVIKAMNAEAERLSGIREEFNSRSV